MSDSNDKQASRSRAFAQRLRTDHTTAPDPRAVLIAEQELGPQSIAYALDKQGTRLLMRALDLERKAKLRAARSGGARS